MAGRTGAPVDPLVPMPVPRVSAGSGSTRALCVRLCGGANAVRRGLSDTVVGTPRSICDISAPSRGISRLISSRRSISAPGPLISAEITALPPAGSRRLCSLCRPPRGDDAVCGTACSVGVSRKGRPGPLLVRSASSLAPARAPCLASCLASCSTRANFCSSALWRDDGRGDASAWGRGELLLIRSSLAPARASSCSSPLWVWRDGGRGDVHSASAWGRGDRCRAPSPAVAARLERPMLLRALCSK